MSKKRKKVRIDPAQELVNDISLRIAQLKAGEVTREVVYSLLLDGARMWRQGSIYNIHPGTLEYLLDKEFCFIRNNAPSSSG